MMKLRLLDMDGLGMVLKHYLLDHLVVDLVEQICGVDLLEM